MKKVHFVWVLFVVCIFANAQQVTTKVDERVELMSIVFRLAEAEEYSYYNNSPYLKRVRNHFEPFKNREFIKYTQLLRETYAIGFDAVMDLALALQIEKGEITFRSNVNIAEIDKRWLPDVLPKYIKMLNAFYKQTKCDIFFKSNADFYKEVELSCQKQVTDNINFKWFGDFFGNEKIENFHLVIGLLNGKGNYGLHIENDKKQIEIYSIIGAWNTDSWGIPQYNSGINGLIAHEFGHSFWNPLIDIYYSQIKEQSEKCFDLVKQKMLKQSYGDAKTFFGEMIDNASVALYSLNQDPYYDETDYLCVAKSSNGFIGIDSLFYALIRYQKQRDKYPTMEDYMPKIVEVFNFLDIVQIYQDIENRSAEILGTNIENNSQNVDYRLDSICVYFSQPMNKGCNGWSPILGCETCNMPKTKDNNPKTKDNNYYWSIDGKTWVVKSVQLEPDTQYDLVFPNSFFRSPDGCFRLKSSYYLSFKTRKKE